MKNAGVETAELRKWSALDADEQLQLREAFGHFLDTLDRTCAMDQKIKRFENWLTEHCIEFDWEP